MFELSVALKYLIPKRKQLSVSLISLMSIAVISLVVWLLLIFLSVTEGIERNWMGKLTALNAPLRINPTPAYFNSYYYLADSISESSGYAFKSIHEKAISTLSDPYAPETDMEIPAYWPKADYNLDQSLKDPVKKSYEILQNLGLTFQDYEIGGAMMRLQLLRPQSQLITEKGDLIQNNLTQVSYIASFADKNPSIRTLLSPLTAQDLNNLFYLANLGALHLSKLCEHIQIKTLRTSASHWKFPVELLPEKKEFRVVAYERQGQFSHFIFSEKKESSPLVREENFLVFKGTRYPLSTPLFTSEVQKFRVLETQAANAEGLQDVHFIVEGLLQGHSLKGKVTWEGIEIEEATAGNLKDLLPQDSSGIFLAKNFQTNGVRLGDRGYLSYTAQSTSSVQEQRLPVHVAGFYDPGIMAVGNKCILAPSNAVHAINLANNSYHLDRTESTGIHVWFPHIEDAEKVKKEILAAFKAEGIDKYWKVTTFKEYEFAKDLIQQFQSDRYLFTLIGIIILTVACCNIISLLVLLVNDKKREIGILQAMGASLSSIAAIFGVCGAVMGIVSCFIGIGAAFLTLHNIDAVVNLLSLMQGHEAFNAAFYGASLPNTLSRNALFFIVIATPILSLLAGLVPAIKACRLRPSAILRSE